MQQNPCRMTSGWRMGRTTKNYHAVFTNLSLDKPKALCYHNSMILTLSEYAA